MNKRSLAQIHRVYVFIFLFLYTFPVFTNNISLSPDAVFSAQDLSGSAGITEYNPEMIDGDILEYTPLSKRQHSYGKMMQGFSGGVTTSTHLVDEFFDNMLHEDLINYKISGIALKSSANLHHYKISSIIREEEQIQKREELEKFRQKHSRSIPKALPECCLGKFPMMSRRLENYAPALLLQPFQVR